jgi:hypothetical protein
MAQFDLRAVTALLCSELLLINLSGCGGHRVALPEVRPPTQVFDPLSEELKKSYLTLFETAGQLEYSDTQIARCRNT